MSADTLIEPPEGVTIELLAVKFSARLDQIALAFVAAQSSFENYKPDSVAQVKSDKGNYAYNYAKLPDVIGATRPALNAQGIGVLQPVVTEAQKVTVQTLLLHKSGQWLVNTLIMTGASGTPQATGSTITYARRYALQALLCVAPDMDDDGAIASSRDEVSRQRERLAQQESDAEGYILARIAKLTIEPDQVAEIVMELTEGAAADWRGLNLENKRRLFATLGTRFGHAPATNASHAAAESAPVAVADAPATAQKPAEEIPPAGTSEAGLRAWLGKRLEFKATSWKAEHMAKATAEVTRVLGLANGTVTPRTLASHLAAYRDAVEKAVSRPQDASEPSDAQNVTPPTTPTPATQESPGTGIPSEPPDLPTRIRAAIKTSGWNVDELEDTVLALATAVGTPHTNWQLLPAECQQQLLDLLEA